MMDQCTKVAAPPVSAQMRDAAHALAARIEGGFFAELEEGQRCDLRELPMAMVGWADRVETMEAEKADARVRRGRGLSFRFWQIFGAVR